MTPKRIRSRFCCFVALLEIALVGIGGCTRQRSNTGESGGQWKSGDVTYVPLEVVDLFVSADNRFVAISGIEKKNAKEPRKLYLLELSTGRHLEIGDDSSGIVFAPQGHRYVLLDQKNEHARVMDGFDNVHDLPGRVRSARWVPDGKAIYILSDWAEQEEGFQGVIRFDLDTLKERHVKLRTITEHFALCNSNGHWFVENRSSGDILKGWTDEYDAEGKFVRTIKEDRGLFSANCKYVLPLWAEAIHGPNDWAVYDAKTQRRVLDLPWIEDGKHEAYWFKEWNPGVDHLVLVGATIPAHKWEGIEVLDVRNGKAVGAWEEADDGPMVSLAWSGDGRSVVMVRDNHIVFDPVH